LISHFVTFANFLADFALSTSRNTETTTDGDVAGAGSCNARRPPNVILLEQPSNLAALSVRLAFLQEACLGGTGQRLSIGADRLAVARVRLAFFQEARLGGTGERLAVFPDRFAFARVCRESGPDGEKRKNESKNKAFHGQPRLISR
jgi:hypothetical protein